MTSFDTINQNPFDWFRTWFSEAELKEPRDHNAMALATSNAKNEPSVRMVLLKEWGPNGFVFYTNTDSHKGQDLSENKRASICFYWKSLSRQIRIDGDVSLVTPHQSDAYFASRPRDAQVGAWASQQSRPMEHMDDLQKAIAKIETQYAGKPIPRPPYWQGYCIVPSHIEFWEEGLFRLHQRVLYQMTKSAKGDWSWTSTRLYP
ncbi:MAG: pyridoxamine 5'-phosphate oxidase [Alphaproteobacteria bacterium]|jgi:pyridoxamine 5'-phosphate oxidase|nr:pyridoxamine 5'-phosphate oxidase [Alphaproteobacteria bacterium]